MLELLHYTFMQNAFLAAFLASIACGIIGSYVVVKRIAFISGGIAHTAFGGIGLGYLLGINPIIVMIPFSFCSALLIGVLSKKSKIEEDSAIGMIWAAGMALGILFIGLSPGYTPDLFSYLFGNILTVPQSDLWIMVCLNSLIISAVLIFYKSFLALCFDEEFAFTRGIPTFTFYLLLLGLTALTIVILMRIVGIILVISLLTIPASIARQFTKNLKLMMFFATLISMILTSGGLLISYYLDLPSGASIILLSVSTYLIIWIIQSRFFGNTIRRFK
ncbi:metal ABC transporter permease [Thermoproteota archaeon]